MSESEAPAPSCVQCALWWWKSAERAARGRKEDGSTTSAGRERERERKKPRAATCPHSITDTHTPRYKHRHVGNTGVVSKQPDSNQPQYSHGHVTFVSTTDCCVHNGQNNNIHNGQNSNVLSNTVVKTTCKMAQTTNYWPKEH